MAIFSKRLGKKIIEPHIWISPSFVHTGVSSYSFKSFPFSQEMLSLESTFEKSFQKLLFFSKKMMVFHLKVIQTKKEDPLKKIQRIAAIFELSFLSLYCIRHVPLSWGKRMFGPYHALIFAPWIVLSQRKMRRGIIFFFFSHTFCIIILPF